MPACKRCGRTGLVWETTPSGKHVLFNGWENAFVPGDGDSYAILPDGKFCWGVVVGDAYEENPYILARASHYGECSKKNE